MRLPLLIALLLFAFSVSADNGLRAVGEGYVKLIILFIWVTVSLITLFIFIGKFLRQRKSIYRYLVYGAFASLGLIYYLVFSTFYEINASLIFDDTVMAAYKAEAKSQFSFLIVFGGILALAIISFILIDKRIINIDKWLTKKNE